MKVWVPSWPKRSWSRRNNDGIPNAIVGISMRLACRMQHAESFEQAPAGGLGACIRMRGACYRILMHMLYKM